MEKSLKKRSVLTLATATEGAWKLIFPLTMTASGTGELSGVGIGRLYGGMQNGANLQNANVAPSLIPGGTSAANPLLPAGTGENKELSLLQMLEELDFSPQTVQCLNDHGITRVSDFEFLEEEDWAELQNKLRKVVFRKLRKCFDLPPKIASQDSQTNGGVDVNRQRSEAVMQRLEATRNTGFQPSNLQQELSQRVPSHQSTADRVTADRVIQDFFSGNSSVRHQSSGKPLQAVSDADIINRISAKKALRAYEIAGTVDEMKQGTYPLFRPFEDGEISLDGAERQVTSGEIFFSSHQSKEKFVSTTKNFGMYVALSVSCDTGMFGDYTVGGSYSNNSMEEQSTRQQLTFSNMYGVKYCTYPKFSFQLPTNSIQLSDYAKQQLEAIGDPNIGPSESYARAREFNDKFKSHICIGNQTIGGTLLHITKAYSSSQTNASILKTRIKQEWSAEVDASFGAGLVGVQMRHSGTLENTNEEMQVDSEANTDISSTTDGPGGDHTRFLSIMEKDKQDGWPEWRLVECGEITDFMPIWEFLDQHPIYRGQFHRPLEILRQVWINQIESSMEKSHRVINAALRRAQTFTQSTPDFFEEDHGNQDAHAVINGYLEQHFSALPAPNFNPWAAVRELSWLRNFAESSDPRRLEVWYLALKNTTFQNFIRHIHTSSNNGGNTDGLLHTKMKNIILQMVPTELCGMLPDGFVSTSASEDDEEERRAL